jgi:hypothetical protein
MFQLYRGSQFYWWRKPWLGTGSFIIYLYCCRGRRGRDRMVVGFTTTYAISAYHHWCCEFESRSGRDVLHLCKIVQSSVILLLHLFSILSFGDILLTDDGATSPLSIAVEKWHFDIVKHIFVLIFSIPYVSQINVNFLDISGVYFLPGYIVVQPSFYFSILLSPNELSRWVLVIPGKDWIGYK